MPRKDDEIEVWTLSALYSVTARLVSRAHLPPPLPHADAEGLGVARYLQLFDLLQQVLQGHVLVTGVFLPDGVLQALQVGFS